MAEVGDRVHAHQDEVVALGEHVLVHLLGPLRHDDQVEAELAPLAGDSDRVRGDERRQRVAWLGGADVVSLVDHDRDRLAPRTPPPEPLEDRSGRDCLLLARRQRPKVHDDAARRRIRVLELLGQ